MNADVLLIGADWRLRALLRAQLIEQGFDVVALGSWDEAELLLRKRAVSARATVFDLEGEPNPQAALSTLARLVPPPTSVVLTSSAALPPADVRRLGFDHVIARPHSIDDAVKAVAALVTPAHDAPG